MSEPRSAYALDTTSDDTREVLSVLPLEILVRLARMVKAVKCVGFGDVGIKITDAKIIAITVTRSERVEEKL
jgi:hypothetical protein